MEATLSANPKGPIRGKSANLATRITPETREALEREAVRSGRSLSQVAELWLELARQGKASEEAMLGGTAVAPTIRAMIELAKLVEQNLGDPSKDRGSRMAIVEGWRMIVERGVPFVPPGGSSTDLALKRYSVKKAFGELGAELADQFVGVMLDPANNMTYDAYFKSFPDADTEQFESLCELNPEAILISLAEVAPSLSNEIVTAQTAWNSYIVLFQAVIADDRQAELMGRELALSLLPSSTSSAASSRQ